MPGQQIQTLTGLQNNSQGVSPSSLRQEKAGSLIIGSGIADYQELVFQGQVFQGANQGPGGTTTSVALATTYTGLCISNPVGSGKNLIILQAGLAIVGAPVALSVVGLLGGWSSTGLTAHTTPLVPLSTFLNQSIATGVGKVDSAATLPSTPTLLLPFATIPITGITAQVANPPLTGIQFDLKGSFIVPPGGYIAIYTSTALTIIGGFVWAEALA